MFVRLKTGNRAGEVHEMKFADAKPLLDDGRAEQVYQEPPEPVIARTDGEGRELPKHAVEAKPRPKEKKK